jgi:isocitrate dehydrogenase
MLDTFMCSAYLYRPTQLVTYYYNTKINFIVRGANMKNISKKETRRLVKNALDYLIAEGVVVKIGNKYRMKTKKEIARELKAIENAKA